MKTEEIAAIFGMQPENAIAYLKQKKCGCVVGLARYA